ncbi:hypothetical protein LZK76_02900 [Rhizobium leguminosarum]|nr:hypothetical protein LZK76_02900 [Rhizobium leguminosarum]
MSSYIKAAILSLIFLLFSVQFRLNVSITQRRRVRYIQRASQNTANALALTNTSSNTARNIAKASWGATIFRTLE